MPDKYCTGGGNPVSPTGVRRVLWLQGNRGAVMTSYAVEVDSMAVLRVTKAEFDQLWDHIPNTLPQVELSRCWGKGVSGARATWQRRQAGRCCVAALAGRACWLVVRIRGLAGRGRPL